MKKKNRTSLAKRLLLALLLVCLVIPVTYADIGPKEALYIRAVNVPEGETLYLDLLVQGTPVDADRPQNMEDEGYDGAVLARLRSLEGDGWVLALTTGVDEITVPIFGDVAPREDGTYYFSYFGLPQTFRLAAATATEAKAMEAPFTRTRYYTNMVYDWAANTLTYATPTPLYWAAQIAATLIPTLLVEGLILFLFGFRERRTWIVFFLVNVATQIGLHLACWFWLNTLVTQAGWFVLAYVVLLIPEAVIWCAEAAVYAFAANEGSRGRRIGYAFAANIASYALTFIPLHLLYEPFTRL